MRLVKPSLGECADRMTILELKIEFGKLREISVAHFEDEYKKIQSYLATANLGYYAKEYKELQHVNRSLWSLEGQVRNETVWREEHWRAASLLEQITRLNDRRAEIVNQIDGTPAQEKLY